MVEQNRNEKNFLTDPKQPFGFFPGKCGPDKGQSIGQKVEILGKQEEKPLEEARNQTQ